jgi:hypothetical protein
LNLECDILVSRFAFEFNLYRYSVCVRVRGMSAAEAEVGPACWRLEGGMLWEDEGGDAGGAGGGGGFGGGPGNSVNMYEVGLSTS